ncbi:hypothetical protein E2C01_004120 [Portunus trituberculatus]|uniref:Uncharacterized protein n=1 Tax=Portunus trituberculatus TaxID=210409 RepID=A0A5B7CVG7_PORTR|nr:hypothetical protein [Portunus trituberculatus]
MECAELGGVGVQVHPGAALHHHPAALRCLDLHWLPPDCVRWYSGQELTDRIQLSVPHQEHRKRNSCRALVPLTLGPLCCWGLPSLQINRRLRAHVLHLLLPQAIQHVGRTSDH